ncbi:MAG: NUDIX hydrolase [Planctomycetota bacterium]
MAGEVLSDVAVFEGARFSIGRVELAGRGGGAVTREVVRPADAVVVLPIVEKAENQKMLKAENGGGGPTVVMIRNRRWAVGRELWELPAGTIEAGEDPAACAERELTEETGYRLLPPEAPETPEGSQGGAEGSGGGRMTRLTAFYPSPGFCTEKLTLFAAVGLERGAQSLDPTEEIAVEPMPMSRALRMVRDGDVADGKTIAGLLWWASWNGEF